MSGTWAIGGDVIKRVMTANQETMSAANELISLAKENPELKEKLAIVVKRLVDSGRSVNEALGGVVDGAGRGRG